MMEGALRSGAAILAGLLLALVVVVAVEVLSSVVHPLPEDFGGTEAEMCEHVARYPQWVLAVVVPAWAATAFVGVWIAQRIGNLISSAIVGLLLLAAVAFNVSMLPYPAWFKAATLVAVPAAMMTGIWLARGRSTRDITQITDRADRGVQG